MRRNLEAEDCTVLKGSDVKLMAQCQVVLRGDPVSAVEIRRGMIVMSMEGKEVGKVAAMAVDTGACNPLCLILGHLPEREHYQSFPVDWIEAVDQEVVFLKVSWDAVLALPNWHPA